MSAAAGWREAITPAASFCTPCWNASTMYSGQAVIKSPDDDVALLGKLGTSRPTAFVANAVFVFGSTVILISQGALRPVRRLRLHGGLRRLRWHAPS